MNRGQAMTHYYRLLSESGGYVWMQSCFCLLDVTTATFTVGLDSDNAYKTTNQHRSSQMDTVIAINYILR